MEKCGDAIIHIQYAILPLAFQHDTLETDAVDLPERQSLLDDRIAEMAEVPDLARWCLASYGQVDLLYQGEE